MKVKFILPALTEAMSPHWRPIKYSLFPPLGLATLAGYLHEDDTIVIQDEHVEKLDLNDQPDLVAIQVYITSAYRAYQIADHYRNKGVPVALGGLHVTALPQEAALHADTIFLGPGEDTWPEFLHDFRAGHPKKIYQSKIRTLMGLPKIRRDLIKKELYLVPNSIVVSRGCPHHCDFCYKDAFYKGGKSFYTQSVDNALQEIGRLPGRHLFFLDDNLFGNVRFASELFDGMRDMGRVWQSAATVQSALNEKLLKKAVKSGLRSLFIGFETLNNSNLKDCNKYQNLNKNYSEAVRRLHDLGVMINGSFVFGMDDDNPSVFDSTVEWAVKNGIETATFHILTPYPGTALYKKLTHEKRVIHSNWDLYDTRHVIFQPAKMDSTTLEHGYWGAYKKFYQWRSIIKAATTKESFAGIVRHLAYAGGWKKTEPLWGFIIRHKQIKRMIPVLENLLNGKLGLTINKGVKAMDKNEKKEPLLTLTEPKGALS
ncbi:B12-binding domain-containing radical SAM protein [Candidatus Omnitrophota bacterium]